MGLRFRKSIKMPGGFRVNLSKSGVGYSWGAKGYRVTKTARGTTRTTISIPGTGLSYVKESKATKLNSSQMQTAVNDKNTQEDQYEIFDSSQLRTLSDHEFTTWAGQYLQWANSLSEDTDERILDYAEKQVQIIHEEIDWREKAKENGQKLFKRIVFGCLICIALCILVMIFAK